MGCKALLFTVDKGGAGSSYVDTQQFFSGTVPVFSKSKMLADSRELSVSSFCPFNCFLYCIKCPVNNSGSRKDLSNIDHRDATFKDTKRRIDSGGTAMLV